MDNVKLLDCTLRDGAYVVDFEFGKSNIIKIINTLIKSNVEYIECGFLGENNNPNKVLFNNLGELYDTIPQYPENIKFALMLNFADKNKFDFESDINLKYKNRICIRIAFFKNERMNALEFTSYLKKLGYNVFLQMMVTHMYTENELLDYINRVNEVSPYCLSLVDSFGTFYNSDIERYFNVINNNMNDTILFGFHSHNNIQMAYSNCVKFIELANNSRNIIIDSTVYGMGRGAGNCPTDLIMSYLNSENKRYNITEIFDIYEFNLKQIHETNYWGYSIEYLLTAQLGINPAYIWYLQKKNIKSLYLISKILNLIPEDSKHYLNVKFIDYALDKEHNG